MASIADLLTNLKATTKKPGGLYNGMPDYGYGLRFQEESDKSPKQPKAVGYYGEINRPDGSGYSTEIGIGNEYGEHPSMVPGLTHRELVEMMTSENIPDSVFRKADKHQMLRMLQGKSSWHGINDEHEPLPLAIPESYRGLRLSDWVK